MVSEGWLMIEPKDVLAEVVAWEAQLAALHGRIAPGLAAASLACGRLPERIAGEGKLARKMIGCALGAGVPFVWVAGGAMGQPQHPASSSATPPGRWRTPGTTADEERQVCRERRLTSKSLDKVRTPYIDEKAQ